MRSTTETDLWFTPSSIKEAYEEVVKETNEWRKHYEEAEAKPKSFFAKLKSTLSRGKKRDMLAVQETVVPRLYKLVDSKAGNVYFELTEVEDGGTVVKVTYNPRLKDRIANFRACSNIKIPKTPIGSNCPSCGKPILREFNICPYCGQKLVRW